MISKVFHPRADFFSTVLFVVRLFEMSAECDRAPLKLSRSRAWREKEFLSRARNFLSPAKLVAPEIRRCRAKTDGFSPRFNFHRAKKKICAAQEINQIVRKITRINAASFRSRWDDGNEECSESKFCSYFHLQFSHPLVSGKFRYLIYVEIKLLFTPQIGNEQFPI